MLGGVIAGFTIEGQLKSQEAKLANNYVRKYQKNSISTNPTLNGLSGIYSSGIYSSGIYSSGICSSTEQSSLHISQRGFYIVSG